MNNARQALEQSLVADPVDTPPIDHFSPVAVRFPVNAPALRPPAVIMPYDTENGTDGTDALNKAITALRNLAYDPEDLSFTFNQIEIKMLAAGVKKQFTKLQALTTVLPKKVVDEIKPILRLGEAEFTENDAYHQAKTEILRIFGQTDDAAFERAMGRVLSENPSQLARGLVNDLCDNKKMNGCCCKNFIGGLWRKQLPNSVKQQISDVPFDGANFIAICKKADQVYNSTRPSQTPATVAAVSAPVTRPTATLEGPAFNEAFHPDMPWPGSPEVAAYTRGRGRGRGRGSGGRGNRGQGQGRGGYNQGNSGQGTRGGGRGGQGNRGSGHPRHKTQRHADLPPFESCFRHWTFGKSAHFCMEPATCPWKDHWTPKANN